MGWANTDASVVEIDEKKLRLAHELGATRTFNGMDGDLAAKIRNVTSEYGVNASCDFVGSEATLALGIGATRFEATLWGTVKELREVFALAESGQLMPVPIERAPLECINDVYARLKRGEVQGRAVISPTTVLELGLNAVTEPARPDR